MSGEEPRGKDQGPSTSELLERLVQDAPAGSGRALCAALGAHLDELHLKTIGTKPLPSPADLLIQLRNLPAREAQWRLEDYLKELRSRMHAGDIVRYSRAVEQWATVKRAELDPKLLLASKRGFMEVVRKAKAFDEYTRVFADFHPRIIDDEINAIFEQISASE